MYSQKPVFQSISENEKIEKLVGESSIIIFQPFNFAVEGVQLTLQLKTNDTTLRGEKYT